MKWRLGRISGVKAERSKVKARRSTLTLGTYVLIWNIFLNPGNYFYVCFNVRRPGLLHSIKRTAFRLPQHRQSSKHKSTLALNMFPYRCGFCKIYFADLCHFLCGVHLLSHIALTMRTFVGCSHKHRVTRDNWIPIKYIAIIFHFLKRVLKK